ncbi:hypothetical protein C8Q76DRAFT_259291 [Earliella scabrosa]|nr:hypothetical protein C8Q76DRAFT_259291 [Earliella scabrosa]
MTPQENSQMLDCRPFWDSDEYIIVPKGLFNHNLSNAIVNASVLRDCENDLYALYAWIIVLNCATIRPPEYPLGSALPIPQPFFGRKGVVLGDPAVKGQPDEVREASGARGHEQDPKQETRTPDFARILVTVSGGDSVDEDVVRRLVDFWEIKRLNIEDPWWTQAGRMAAGVELKRHLGQVYDSAMAAFESNPEWTEVSALLVVGIWFTQFRWERPPSLISSRDSSTHNGEDLEGMISALAIASSLDDDSLHAGATSSRAPGASTSTLLPPEEPPAPTSPATPLLNADRFFTQIARQLESTLPEIKDHSIPTIVYYNQCVVDHSYDDRLGMRYSLSDDFLDAIANSLDGYDADLQPSWFVRKNKERERAISDEEVRLIILSL